MANASFRSVASARTLVSVTVGVMVAFVATTAISQLVESQSARDVDDIVGNAMPSVQALSMLRGDLYEMQDLLGRRSEIDAAKLSRELADQRRDVEAALATYRRLPFFEGEGVLYAPGLGLATVERLARAHGGSIGVVSPPGRGALFWVELPAVATS